MEEHSEDTELKATAFSTHRTNMFTQIITDNEISYKSNIKYQHKIAENLII